MASRTVILFLLLFFHSQLSPASDWKKTARFQLSFGRENNIFEEINSKISDTYLRGLLSQNWRRVHRTADINLNLTTWGAIYANHPVENKYFLKFQNFNTIHLGPVIAWQIGAHSQIKKFVQLNHGFWQNHFSNGLLFRLSRKNAVKLDIFYENFQFFNNNRFDQNRYSIGLTLTHSFHPQVSAISRVILGKVTLPNRTFLRESYSHVSQKDRFVGLDFGMTYQKNIFFSGLLHLEKQNSNFSGLDYFLAYSNLIFVYKMFTRWYLRSNLRFQFKRYKGGFLPDQMVSIDPEEGEGSNGNVDVICKLNSKFSLILRTRLFRQESTFRNQYYSNKIFELMVEIK